MTQWNYFLLQIKRAEALKLSIQLYTATPEGAKYELSDKVWSAMEFMLPILELIEQSCNVFQARSPTKHLVLPYYHVIIKQLDHYERVIPHTWHNACEAARAKLQKYYNIEINNNTTLTATLLNPKYHKEIVCTLGVPAEQSRMIIEFLCHECTGMQAQNNKSQCAPNSPDYQSDPDKLDILQHLNQVPIESTQVFSGSDEDEVLNYLQNLHPVGKGEHILDYWKVCLTCNCLNHSLLLMCLFAAADYHR
ncbi:hypothetical protein O181_094123 [Austropuccinia psidii MF-1]|uniref:Uncharacterized protein n=1 Tax=Austropuccinia psidii MF-1 TaxID=1389203 RepID=A0A9Q3J1H9_9BASI|nr:hypothetical protein [Austropuccinia psidii MF-1]